MKYFTLLFFLKIATMKKLFKILFSIILVIALIIDLLQIPTPIYSLPEPTPFSGTEFHNPYAKLDSTVKFVKVNLHAHQSRKGAPLEMMYDYQEGEFDSLYSEAGYHLALITDHQYINPLSPVSAYEHGYNLQNFHINSFKTTEMWGVDIPFMLNARSQMQWQINQLKKRAQYLSLNHPSRLRMGFTPDHISTLRGYDFIEMDCIGGNAPWDIALSSGYYPMLTATDDSHYPDPRKRFQGRYTMVTLDEQGEIWQGLKDGMSYGVELHSGEPPRGKCSEPTLLSVKLKGDTLLVAMKEAVDSVLFIGQGGAVMQSSKAMQYIVQHSDTYIRTELFLSNGMVVWLNPIARVSALNEHPEVDVSYLLTALNIIWRLILAIVILKILKWLWRRKRTRMFYTAY